MAEVAIIGWNKNEWNVEADVFSSLDQLLKNNMKSKEYNIIVINDNFIKKDRFSQLKKLSEKIIGKKLILVEPDPIKPQELIKLLHQFPIVAMVKKEESSRVQDLILAILLTKRLEEQTEVYQKLLEEDELNQENQYQKLMNDLLDKQKQVNEIQNRILSNLQQEKLLHDTLLLLITSQSLAEIELRLQEVLQPLLGDLHIRILIHSGTTYPQTLNEANVSFELFEHEKSIGKIVFASIENKTFSKRDLRTLENVSDAVSLHIPKLMAHETNISLETEWRATFDAISDPLITVSEDYMLVEANKAARDKMNSPLDSGEPCYKLLFQRLSPCEFCRWGKKSNIEVRPSKPGELWEMSSHELSNNEHLRKNSQRPLYVHLYRNKFHQRELEDKLKTYAQTAEVGIFKASLAHELNNPIGGLLTLAQLQKMDLPKENALYPVICDIEKQALLCRDLIQNLLQRSKEL